MFGLICGIIIGSFVSVIAMTIFFISKDNKREAKKVGKEQQNAKSV